jgi:hypothetical protein
MAGKTRSGKTAATNRILDKYERMKQTLGHADGTTLIAEIVSDCFAFLQEETRRLPLKSMVNGKRYFAFGQPANQVRTSRPVNEDLFISDQPALVDQLEKLKANPGMDWLSAEECNRFLYTVAMSFCAFSDVTSDGDKKTPGTFFELLVGHLLALTFGVKPRNRVEVLTVEDERSTLPTDFIFDLGPKRLKFHVPVKISTRERVVQVWAHQRMLNGVYGEGRFKGVLVALAETKLNLRKLEVVEICLPIFDNSGELRNLFRRQIRRRVLRIRIEQQNRVFSHRPIVDNPCASAPSSRSNSNANLAYSTAASNQSAELRIRGDPGLKYVIILIA